ncbi:MAG: hypothetical protein OEV79_01895 [candidate division WOR-3 bacterium]|nr:hypothetical protein [candidate division WOR-3 bacterium]
MAHGEPDIIGTNNDADGCWVGTFKTNRVTLDGSEKRYGFVIVDRISYSYYFR